MKAVIYHMSAFLAWWVGTRGTIVLGLEEGRFVTPGTTAIGLEYALVSQ